MSTTLKNEIDALNAVILPILEGNRKKIAKATDSELDIAHAELTWKIMHGSAATRAVGKEILELVNQEIRRRSA